MTTAREALQRDQRRLWGLRPVRWGLRILELGGYGLAASYNDFQIFDVANFLGIALEDSDGEEGHSRQLLAGVADRQLALQGQRDSGGLLRRNLRLLQRALGLSDTDLDLIALRAMLRMHEGFTDLVIPYLGNCPDFLFHRRLAAMFGLPLESVERALDARGALAQSGLALIVHGVLGPLDERFCLYRGLISELFGHHPSAASLLAALLPPKREGHLQLIDYSHLGEEIRLLRDYLGAAVAARRPCANVLLYGVPGCGKTELAAALAQSIDCHLYEVRAGGDNDCQMTPRERLVAVTLSQKLVYGAGAAIVLVDEAEDLFPPAWSDPEKTPTKVVVNECLESNPAPTVWISNDTSHMDEAYLRRFDVVLHVTPLPAEARSSLLRQQLPPGILEDSEIRVYASQARLSPATLVRMADVACSAAQGNRQRIRQNLRTLSRHYLQTLGENPLPSSAPVLQQDLGLLNTDVPLDTVLATLDATPIGARMLLYGPPGTGKSALGVTLAERLDRPLIRRQASTLLSRYVGETEHRLRGMFEEARYAGGLLLLDEADSFLGSRDATRARWETTQTNELLTQMEAFEGIFICTTNRLGDLDAAALRRFDLKVAFRPLRKDQRERLIRQCCARLAITPAAIDPNELAAEASRLDGLTPGDAAAALRHLRLVGSPPDLPRLLSALAAECHGKPGAARPMGFLGRPRRLVAAV